LEEEATAEKTGLGEYVFSAKHLLLESQSSTFVLKRWRRLLEGVLRKGRTAWAVCFEQKEGSKQEQYLQIEKGMEVNRMDGEGVRKRKGVCGCCRNTKLLV
jgi:hypothetical protein